MARSRAYDQSAKRESDIRTDTDLVTTIASYATQKKAVDPVILDVEELVGYCSHFVICSGTSSRQVRAIANHIVASMKTEQGVRPVSVEGMQTGKWVALDFGDVVVHVFDRDMRGFYDLEGLWSDAPRVALPGELRQMPAAAL